MDFSKFLSRMTNETSGRKSPNINEGSQRSGGNKPQAQTPRTATKPKPRKIVEDDHEEYEEEEEVSYHQEEKPKNKSKIDEEFMDKAYDYAQGIIKVVRNNFKSTEERIVMLREIQKAAAFYLQSVGVQQNSQSFETPIPPTSNDMFATEARMSESEWDSMPKIQNEQVSHTGVKMNDLTGSEVNIKPVQPTGDYSPNLNLGIKIGPDGKQEADLSGVTQTDINEMRILAGMIGPEAEQRAREEKAAQEQLRAEMSEKEN